MNNNIIDSEKDESWGIDANPKDNPAYPMREDTPEDHFKKGLAWTRPTLQKADVEVLHSNERPNLSAVFGSTIPPKYLSGMIRRVGFKYSESDLRHWMLLMLADRINMIEGVFEDLFSGKVPNIFVELGGKSEWKYNKAGFIKKTIGVVAVAAILIAVIF